MLPSLPAEEVVYHVVPTTHTLWSATGAAFSFPTDAAVESVPDYVSPVSMNIGLIVGVAIAIAVLLCMLAYVVYKCIVVGQRPGLGARGAGADCIEKTALGVGQDFSPPHAPPFAINGRPPPILTNDSLSPRTKKDVKEWFV